MRRYISLLLFIGLALGQTTIAVFPLENNGLKDSDARILTDRLQSEFVKIGDYTVVERNGDWIYVIAGWDGNTNYDIVEKCKPY